MCLSAIDSPVLVMDYSQNRIDILTAIRDSHKTLLRTVKAFNNDLKPSGGINKKDLEAFPLFVWVDLNENIKVRKRKNVFGEYLNFDTEIKMGGEFGRHFHDDIIESCEVISGKMQDAEDGAIYEVGDIMHYEKGEPHIPIALEYTVLKVLFKP